MCEVIDLTIEPTIIESITPIVSRVRLASEVNSEKDSEVPLAKRLRMDDEKKEDDEREIEEVREIVEVIEPETCESELVCDNVTTRKETKSDSQRAFEEAKEGGSSDSDDSDDSNDSDDES